MEHQKKVLEASQRTLGSKHPGTLRAMSYLADSYSELERTQEAMELWEKVLEASQRTLGSEHPDTLRAMKYLANSYRILGRTEEAMELEENCRGWGLKKNKKGLLSCTSFPLRLVSVW